MQKKGRFKLFVPVMGFIALAAVGLCIYLMQSRIDGMKEQLSKTRDTLLSAKDSLGSTSVVLSEDVMDDMQKATDLSDNFCTYLDSLKNLYINNGGVATISEKVFYSRMQYTCLTMLALVKDTAAKTRLSQHQFCSSATPGQIKAAIDHSPLAAVMMYLERTETDCREFEKRIIDAIEKR